MSSLDELRYLDTHEWHRAEGGVCTIGISRFAIDELTDITYVELPEVGREVSEGETIGEIESVKATSELYTGVSGKVVEVNAAVADDPSVVNQDPYEAGWLVKIEMTDPTQLDALLDAEGYGQKYPS